MTNEYPTCDKCGEPITVDQYRYTPVEPAAFRHLTCQYNAPIYSIPPTAESTAECVRLGLLIDNGPGLVAGPTGKIRHRQQWGEVEMRELVNALWPGIPKAGVDFDAVLARARRANELLVEHGETPKVAWQGDVTPSI